jgi:hypothetical protein
MLAHARERAGVGKTTQTATDSNAKVKLRIEKAGIEQTKMTRLSPLTPLALGSGDTKRGVLLKEVAGVAGLELHTASVVLLTDSAKRSVSHRAEGSTSCKAKPLVQSRAG